MNETKERLADPAKLLTWTSRVFQAHGIPEKDAEVTAKALLAADLRGIDSHGVARMPLYLNKIKNKSINCHPRPFVVHETRGTALYDGDNGLGPVVARQAMQIAIDKAKDTGVGAVAVRNSNHYGIAAYYTMMALEHDMIGISCTNSVSMVSPTFGTKNVLGTNPLSLAAPAGKLRPFVLDMATSTVPMGKIENAWRNQSDVPMGWVFDQQGKLTTDPKLMLKGGTLTPLGGYRETGGHKGYGLVLMVDILSAVLSNAFYGAKQEGLMSMRPEPSNVGHFFAALRVDGFRPAQEFKETMDQALTALKDSPRATGQDRIYIHGEPEFEMEEKRRAEGIPLHPVVISRLIEIGAEVNLGIEEIFRT
jgi:L-2-hydroxycarboxylate dehydrogenase (NAD+)